MAGTTLNFANLPENFHERKKRKFGAWSHFFTPKQQHRRYAALLTAAAAVNKERTTILKCHSLKTLIN